MIKEKVIFTRIAKKLLMRSQYTFVRQHETCCLSSTSLKGHKGLSGDRSNGFSDSARDFNICTTTFAALVQTSEHFLMISHVICIIVILGC